jgi:hypothetical protein
MLAVCNVGPFPDVSRSATDNVPGGQVVRRVTGVSRAGEATSYFTRSSYLAQSLSVHRGDSDAYGDTPFHHHRALLDEVTGLRLRAL